MPRIQVYEVTLDLSVTGNTVFHGPDHPSRLILLVISR